MTRFQVCTAGVIAAVAGSAVGGVSGQTGSVPGVLLAQQAGPVDGVQAVALAPNPSSAIDAYARARQGPTDTVALESAFVKRMVEFGLPEMADTQATDLTAQAPGNALGWAVSAYMSAKRGQSTDALAQIAQAVKLNSQDEFIQRTGGQLLAWYDTQKPAVPDQVARDIEEIVRPRLRGGAAYEEAYSSAKASYAAAPVQSNTPAPSAPDTYVPPAGVSSTPAYVEPYTNPYYVPTYYDGGAYATWYPSVVQPWWWWPGSFGVVFVSDDFHHHHSDDHHHDDGHDHNHSGHWDQHGHWNASSGTHWNGSGSAWNRNTGLSAPRAGFEGPRMQARQSWSQGGVSSGSFGAGAVTHGGTIPSNGSMATANHLAASFSMPARSSAGPANSGTIPSNASFFASPQRAFAGASRPMVFASRPAAMGTIGAPRTFFAAPHSMPMSVPGGMRSGPPASFQGAARGAPAPSHGGGGGGGGGGGRH